MMLIDCSMIGFIGWLLGFVLMVLIVLMMVLEVLLVILLKIVCLFCSYGVGLVVMKNCELLVFLGLFVMVLWWRLVLVIVRMYGLLKLSFMLILLLKLQLGLLMFCLSGLLFWIMKFGMMWWKMMFLQRGFLLGLFVVGLVYFWVLLVRLMKFLIVFGVWFLKRLMMMLLWLVCRVVM